MKVVLLLVLIVVGSALAVVQMKYKTRMLFAELQRQQQTVDSYDERLNQLQLEQNTWSERGRIEKVAREQLGMDYPPRNLIIPIKP